MDGLLGRGGLVRETVLHQGGRRKHRFGNPGDRYLHAPGRGGRVDSRVVVRNTRLCILFVFRLDEA